MATVIDFQTRKARRNGLSAALAAYISELEADGMTLDTRLSIGAILADVARLAGIETPATVAAWLNKLIA